MIDETGNDTTRVGETGGEAANERVGFCQDCGTALNRQTVRTVGSGVFCEPCLEKRLGTAPAQAAPAGYAAGAQTSRSAYVNGGVPPQAVITGAPKPGLAAVLGLIPGVGACYNGQYAKGLIHLVIWATLMELSDHVWIFSLFVLAWEIYMSLEAYHTAKSRRDGLPLPNPFGFNEMGERMGFNKGWAGSAPRPYVPTSPYAPTAQPGPAQAPPYPASANAPGWAPPTAPGSVPPPPPYGAPQNYGAAPTAYGVPPSNWAGYVPPVHFGGPVPPVAPYVAPAQQADAAAGAAPYADTFGGTNPASAMPPVGPAPGGFPVGAIWLIAFGALVLVGTLNPELRISGQWILTALFGGLAAWIFTRKLSYLGGIEALHSGNVARLACILRGPVILLVLAVMFALQAAHVATLGQTWPVLVIAFGVLLILERTVGSTAAVYSGPWAGAQGPVMPPTDPSAPPQDASKGGQA